VLPDLCVTFWERSPFNEFLIVTSVLAPANFGRPTTRASRKSSRFVWRGSGIGNRPASMAGSPAFRLVVLIAARSAACVVASTVTPELVKASSAASCSLATSRNTCSTAYCEGSGRLLTPAVLRHSLRAESVSSLIGSVPLSPATPTWPFIRELYGDTRSVSGRTSLRTAPALGSSRPVTVMLRTMSVPKVATGPSTARDWEYFRVSASEYSFSRAPQFAEVAAPAPPSTLTGPECCCASGLWPSTCIPRPVSMRDADAFVRLRVVASVRVIFVLSLTVSLSTCTIPLNSGSLTIDPVTVI